MFVLEAAEFSVVEPLLEWAPLVVVSENAVERVLIWGIKIDVVLQEKRNRAELEELLQMQFPVTIVPARNGTVNSGLTFILESGHTAVNIVGVPSDGLLQSIEDAHVKLQINIFWELQKWSYVTSGIYEKWLESGQSVEIRQKSGSNVSVHGLENTSKNAWKVVQSGLVTVKSGTAMWIGHQISEG